MAIERTNHDRMENEKMLPDNPLEIRNESDFDFFSLPTIWLVEFCVHCLFWSSASNLLINDIILSLFQLSPLPTV